MQETFNSSATRLQAARLHANGFEVIKSYYQLTKPRIILLLLITTAAGSLVAARGQVDGRLLLATLVGGALASGAANTINCLYDRDIDYIMERTRWRPLPSGRVQPRDALLFAIALTSISFTLLATVANLLAASLAMAGIVFYVLIYTHWLKRHTTQNIVIGGAAGAIPPLVGWAAVTGDLSLAPWLMFLIICLWTPPHFWALALMIRDDYKNVGVPMLPVVEGSRETTRQILLYSFILVPVTLMLSLPGQSNGIIYGVLALVLGIELIRRAIALWLAPEERAVAKGLFTYSIFYLMLLSAAMVVDVLPILQGLNNSLLCEIQAVAHAIPMFVAG